MLVYSLGRTVRWATDLEAGDTLTRYRPGLQSGAYNPSGYGVGNWGGNHQRGTHAFPISEASTSNEECPNSEPSPRNVASASDILVCCLGKPVWLNRV